MAVPICMMQISRSSSARRFSRNWGGAVPTVSVAEDGVGRETSAGSILFASVYLLYRGETSIGRASYVDSAAAR